MQFAYIFILSVAAAGVYLSNARSTRVRRQNNLAYQMASGYEDVVGTVRESFSCQGRDYGYYADIDNNCQVYHICNPPNQHWTFFCPNTTIFDQKAMVCNNADVATPCQDQERFYQLNQNFGVEDNNQLIYIE